MNTIPLQWIIVTGVAVVALLAVAVWLLSQKKKQSARLQQRFGAEYGRTVGELGGRTKAESELKAREKRVEHLSITPLSPAEAARFSQAWNALQGRFVDNPKGVVIQADQLVRDMNAGDAEDSPSRFSADACPHPWPLREKAERCESGHSRASLVWNDGQTQMGNC